MQILGLATPISTVEVKEMLEELLKDKTLKEIEEIIRKEETDWYWYYSKVIVKIVYIINPNEISKERRIRVQIERLSGWGLLRQGLQRHHRQNAKSHCSPIAFSQAYQAVRSQDQEHHKYYIF